MEGQAFPFRYDVSTLLRVCSILLQLVVLDFRPRGCHVVEGVLPLNGRACDPASFDASPMLRHPSCNMFSLQHVFVTAAIPDTPSSPFTSAEASGGWDICNRHGSSTGTQISPVQYLRKLEIQTTQEPTPTVFRRLKTLQLAQEGLWYTRVLLRQNQPVVESPRALLPHLRRLAGLETSKERVLQRLNSPFNARLLALVRSAHHPRPTWLGK